MTASLLPLLVVAFSSLLALMLPIVAFLCIGRLSKRAKVVGRLPPSAIIEYFKCFPQHGVQLPEEMLGDRSILSQDRRKKQDRELRNMFARFYDGQFGWKHFVLPLITLTTLSTALITWTTITLSSKEWLNISNQVITGTLPALAIFSFAGGYMRVLFDAITRCSSRQLRPVDINLASLRLLMCIPLGYAFAAWVKEDIAPPMVFCLGFLTTQNLFRTGRRLLMRTLPHNDKDPANHERSELQLRLEGVDMRIADSLADEGITTQLAMAYADPVVLNIRTNLGFSLVVDLASQALLSIYISGNLEDYRACGIRGAQETSNLWDELEGFADEDRAERAQSAVDQLVAKTGLDQSVLIRTIDEIANDPYTKFMHASWSSPFDDDEYEETDDVE